MQKDYLNNMYLLELQNGSIKTYSKRNWKSVPILGLFLNIFLLMMWDDLGNI